MNKIIFSSEISSFFMVRVLVSRNFLPNLVNRLRADGNYVNYVTLQELEMTEMIEQERVVRTIESD